MIVYMGTEIMLIQIGYITMLFFDIFISTHNKEKGQALVPCLMAGHYITDSMVQAYSLAMGHVTDPSTHRSPCSRDSRHTSNLVAITNGHEITLSNNFEGKETGFTFTRPPSRPVQVMSKPPRTAKTLANFRLLGRAESYPENVSRTVPPNEPGAMATPGPAQPAGTNQAVPVATTADTPIIPAANLVNPLLVHTGLDQAAQPAPDPNTMAGLYTMIKDLTVQMEKRRSRSSSRHSRRRKNCSTSTKRSSPDRSSSDGRSGRSGSGRRRSSSGRSGRRSPRRRSRSTSTSYSRGRDRRRRSSSRSSRRPRSPRAARKDRATREEAATALDKQYPAIGKPTGKRISTRDLVLQPYRHLPPDLKKKAGDRRSRRDLTFPEHVCGVLNVVAESMEQGTDAHALVVHTAQVAQDAATLPWCAVREWTQASMAHLTGGAVKWGDTDLIASERTRLSWIKGRQMEQLQRAPCPEHNTTKCTERDTHAQDGRTWLHVCATCFYATNDERANHTAKNCWVKGNARHGEDNKGDHKGKYHNNKPKKDRQDNRPKN